MYVNGFIHLYFRVKLQKNVVCSFFHQECLFAVICLNSNHVNQMSSEETACGAENPQEVMVCDKTSADVVLMSLLNKDS